MSSTGTGAHSDRCPHAAGGAAYFFAKRSINADRAERYEAEVKRRRIQAQLEYQAPPTSAHQNDRSRASDYAGSPSQEASSDPAPTRHAPENEGQRVREKSKYEASAPFRAKKGDRFS